MAKSPETPEEEPIEVEFTSADPTESKTAGGSGGPGWVGLISVGVVAALAGGAIGVVAGGSGGRYAQASEVKLDLAQLEQSDLRADEKISRIDQEITEIEAGLKTVLDNNEETSTRALRQVRDVRTDLDALKAAYVSLIGDVNTAAPEDQTEASDDGQSSSTPTPDGDDLPITNVSLASLNARLNAMEAIEEDGSATPSELARSVASLQERADQLEEVDIRLREAIAARESVLDLLKDDVDTLESGVTRLEGQVETNTETLKEGEFASQQTLDDLNAELVGLKRLVNDRLSEADNAKLNQNEQETVRRADRVLALSVLETAIRSGDPFADELEALAVQLPANTRITSLRRIAEEGAPTNEQLRSELSKLKSQIAKVGIPKKRSGDWAWVDDAIGSVVTVREEGTISGETASKKVETALNLIAADDLPGAITELKPIVGEQGDILADWLEKADRRVRTDSLLERLRSDIISQEDRP